MCLMYTITLTTVYCILVLSCEGMHGHLCWAGMREVCKVLSWSLFAELSVLLEQSVHVGMFVSA